MELSKLSIGDSGDEVTRLHERLALHGVEVSPEEQKRKFFGPSTRAGVADVQKAQGIDSTGEVTREIASVLLNQPPASSGGVTTTGTAPFHSPTSGIGSVPSPFGPAPSNPVPADVPAPTAADRQVTGRILFDHGLPADGVALRFYNKDFGSEVRLGETRTDAQGVYAMPYSAGGAAVNLEVRAVDSQGNETPLSETKFNAGKTEALNLVAPATIQPLAPEYQRLSTDVVKQIGDINKLGGAQEVGERQDLTLLNQSTGWDARLIALAANANKTSSETGISQEALYGMYRAGLPTDKQQLAQLSVDTVEKALGKVKEAGVVSLSDQQMNETKSAFQNFARTTRLTTKALGAPSTFGALLSVAGSTEGSRLNETEKNTFADLYFAHRGSASELWQKAREQGIPEAKIKGLQLQGKLAYLTMNNAELASSLQTEIGSIENLDQLVEKDLYKKDAWKARLTDQMVPPTYEGGVDGYADDLARKVRMSFPSKVVARMVEKDELRLGDDHEALKAPVRTFLNNAVSQGFELGRVPLGTFIEQNREAVFKGIAESDIGTTTAKVERLQRLYQITPSDEALKAVMELGFESAHDVTAYSHASFVEHFGKSFRSPDEAGLIYRKSEQVTTVIHNFFTAAKQLENAPPIYAVSAPAASRVEAKNQLIKHYPTMESLFGSLDYCECEHCRSVLSPAAYLVDLLQFLEPKDLVWKSTVDAWKLKHGGAPYPFGNQPAWASFLSNWKEQHPGQPDPDTQKKPYDVLIERRPDLPHLPLTCENTNTALPYIDIVNEVLEYYVAKERLDEQAVHDTGAATTPELLAEPQNVVPAAYDKLKEARYPLTLPFDLWLETVRQFFEASETPLWQVLEFLRPSDELFPPASNPKPYYRAAIFAEYLGISPAEYTIFTSPNPLTNWFELYGYASEADALIALRSAKTLSRRLGISYKDIVEVVKTAFINPRLDSLVVLRKLGIEAQDFFRYKREAGYTELSEAERQAFDQRLTDLGKSVGLTLEEIKSQLDSAWQPGSMGSILLLADPDTGCSFDLTRLRYGDGQDADAQAFLLINLFVRLWKKLGWTLEETDRALQIFLPKSLQPLGGANIGAALTSALVYLAHLKSISERISVGKNSRMKLLTLWSGIPTTGKNPLYAQLFLKRSVLKNDAVFDDAFGAYLSKPDILLKDHLLAIQSALNLTADEVGRIFADGKMDLNTSSLSLDSVSHLFRYGLLAKALKLSIRELISLKALSGLDPFQALSSAPVTSISEDHPFQQTLGFVEVAAKVKDSGFKVEDLDYLLRDRLDPVGRYRLTPETSLGIVKTLAAGIRRIQIEQAVPEDSATFTDDELRQKLALALPADVAETFLAMWSGTREYEAIYPNPVLPADKLNPETLAGEPSISVRYDDARREQRLTIRGVLLAERKAELKTRFPSAMIGKLLDDVQDQAKAYFKNYLEKSVAEQPVAGFLEASDYDLLFAPLPDGLSDPEKQNRMRAKRERLAKGFLPFLQQRLIRQLVLETLKTNLNADAGLIETLLTRGDLLADSMHPGKSLLDAFAVAGERGISASFFASADGTGPLLVPTSVTNTVDTATKPASANSSRLEGYLEVPATGAYRFFILLGKKGVQAELRFAHLSDPLLGGVASADGTEISQFTELKAGTSYGFTLSSNSLGGGDVALMILGQDLARGSLSRLTLYPQAVIERVDRAWILLSKTVQLIQGFGLSDREATYLLGHASDFAGLDLSKLPTRESEDSSDGARTLFAGFLRLTDLAHLKRDLSETTSDLISIFENARRSYSSTVDINQTKAALLDDLYKLVAALTRRDVATVRAASESLGVSAEHATVGSELRVSVPAFTDERGVARLWDVLQLVERLGIPVEGIVRWATPTPGFAVARDLKDTVKARYEPENWQRIAQPIFDKLRQRQRDALVAYVIHRHGFERLEQLFEYFLIDPGMEPVVQTSRLRLAISSVQLFIQRCLLNLEPQVHPSAINANHWLWMKRYRVWEANRKIFLFPENWLEPEFRDDKTFLFEELESVLLQGDVSKDLVEDAFYKYLIKLEELAKLDIVAMYCDPKPDPGQNVIYVVGRTHLLPHKYFHRRYAHQMWTPWEEITAEIEGDHLAVVLWRERLHLFWLTFMEKAIPPPIQRNSWDKQTLANMTFDDLSGHVSAGIPRIEVTVQLSWTELFQGQWTTRKSTNFINLHPGTTLSSFDKGRVFLYPDREYDESGEERAVRINLSGDVNGAFRMVSKNSQPQPSESPILMDFTYSGTTRSATQYTASGGLEVYFIQQIKTEDGKFVDSEPTGKPILKKGDGYKLLTCNDVFAFDFVALAKRLSVKSLVDSDGKVNDLGRWYVNTFLPTTLTVPFFYQDDHNLFFVEPTLTETTIDRWEEWVIPPPVVVKEWEGGPWATLAVESHVPRTTAVLVTTGPSVIDPIARFPLQSKADWATHPTTLFEFGDRLVGEAGGFDTPALAVASVSQVRSLAAAGGATSAGPGGTLAAETALGALSGSHNEVMVVSGGGLTAIRTEPVKSEAGSIIARGFSRSRIIGGP